MNHPPFNIFTQRLDPEGTLARLLELLPNSEVSYHADGTWAAISGCWKRGWLKKALTLKVQNNPDYYAGDEWRTQLAGMANYFRQFPGSEAREDVFGFFPCLKFALSFTLDPDPVDGDPRQELIFEMVKFMEGVIFLPTCLLDGEGRVLLAANGENDPDATLPTNAVVFFKKGFSTEEGIENDAEHELRPPTLEQIQARLVLMAALVDRGVMEDSPDIEGEQQRAALVKGLRGSLAWELAEPFEREALECPAGELKDQTTRNLEWLSEGAMVLAWALQLADLPAYDEQVDVYVLYDVRDRLIEGSVVSVLRDAQVIDKLAFQMLAIHWRLQQYSLESKALDFVDYAKRAWCGPMDLSLAKLIDNDLAVGNAPFVVAPEEAWRCANGIMQERRKAAHWLLGHEPVYSENDAST